MKTNQNHKTIILLFIFLLLSISGCTGSHLRVASYQQIDFQGSWTMIGFGHNKEAPFNTLSYLTMNDTGAITGGDTVEFGYDTKVFTGGKLSFSEDDSLSGYINTYLPDVNHHDKHGLTSGKMHKNKDLIVFSGRFPVFHRGIGILIKKWQNFEQSELEGNWVFPINNDMLSILISPSGNVKGCLIASSKESVICSGKININPEGSLKGQFSYTYKNNNYDISFDGQMNKNRDIMIFAGSISTSFEGIASFAIKRDDKISIDSKGSWLFYMTLDEDAIFGRVTVGDKGDIIIGNLSSLSGKSMNVKGEFLINKDLVSGYLKDDSKDNTFSLNGYINTGGDFGGGVYRDKFANSGIFVFIRDFRL